VSALLLMTILVAVIVIANLMSSPVARPSASLSQTHHGAHVGHPARAGNPSIVSAQPVKAGIPAAESGVLPWQLPQPVSREVAVAGPQSGHILVLGGLTASDASLTSVADIQVPGGTSSNIGTLAAAGHDSAGAVLGGHVLVFGGGAQSTVSSVQSYPLARSGTAAVDASTIGQLPQPRSDAAAATVGRTAYVVGGYDGSHADPQVLATTDGRSFHTVGILPVPVRYPAVAVLGQSLYVFGGETVGAGAATVADIQAMNTATGHIRVVGRLPQPLAGAAAVTIGHRIYLAGGSAGGTDSSAIYAFDPASGRALAAGNLMVPVSNAAITEIGGTAWLIGGEHGGTPTANVQMLKPNLGFGVAGAPGAGSPFYGKRMLVADRGNNRLIVLDDADKVVWTYPNAPSMPPPPGPRGFYFPDDAFFFDHGTTILSNQEENETLVRLSYPSGAIQWSYGHPAQIGASPGYLHEPDDAYALKDGNVTVADSGNCRILVINPSGAIVHQIGTTGSCVHSPPTSLGSPNGDTPLADGNLLISETLGSYISEYTQSGNMVWTTHLAIGYPSDPQQLGPDLYLCADYENPGGIIEFNRAGQILYQYRATSGINRLNQPSLVELIPSGVFVVNDDYRDRMAAIDPATQAMVWDYGIPDTPGTGPGYLSIPDGFDILNPDGSTPTHPQTG